jgi:hypothetical protein
MVPDEFASKLRYHGNAERSSAIEHLGDAGAASDDVHKIGARQTHLIEAKQNGVDRIWRVDGMMSRLVGVYERDQNFQLVGFWLPRPGTPKPFDLAQSLRVIALISNWVNVHVLPLLHQRSLTLMRS